MSTQKRIIVPIIPIPGSGQTAIEVAALCYAKWMGEVKLEEDIGHYMVYGLVLSIPSCFALLKEIECPKTGQPAWFIRMAVGRIDELLSHLPYQLPRICFCRRNDGVLRSYRLERLRYLTGGKAYGRWTTRPR